MEKQNDPNIEMYCTVKKEHIAATASGKTRISMAYGQLEEMPSEILTQIAERIQYLDLTYNNFKDLSFLKQFPLLQTLILDRNCNIERNTFPKMENLKVLWLNNCNLINIYEWLYMLKSHCPHLQILSMMCNPVGQTELNGVTNTAELEYRRDVIKIVPQLSYFDGRAIIDMHEENDLKESNLLLRQLENGLYSKLSVFQKMYKQFSK